MILIVILYGYVVEAETGGEFMLKLKVAIMIIYTTNTTNNDNATTTTTTTTTTNVIIIINSMTTIDIHIITRGRTAPTTRRTPRATGAKYNVLYVY